MSLFVQTNVTSLNAQQNFSKTQLALSNTMKKLSSGYKINSAADDAATAANTAPFWASAPNPSGYRVRNWPATFDRATPWLTSPVRTAFPPNRWSPPWPTPPTPGSTRRRPGTN